MDLSETWAKVNGPMMYLTQKLNSNMVLVRTTDSAIRHSTTPYHLGFMSASRPARHHFAFMRQHWLMETFTTVGQNRCLHIIWGPPKIINVYSVNTVKMKRGRICSCTAPLQRVVVGLFLIQVLGQRGPFTVLESFGRGLVFPSFTEIIVIMRMEWSGHLDMT